MRTPLRIAVSSIVVALAATGCFGGDGGDDSESTADGAEATEADAPVDPDQVIVEASYSHGHSDGGSADIAIHELRAREKLVRLTFSITPHDPEGNFSALGGPRLRTVFEDLPVSLVDTSNLNRHVVVADGNQNPLRPDRDLKLKFGQPATLSYTFAAPPEDVTSMDVYIGEFPPFTDVPVER